jgi:hypothetical protein
LYKDWVVLSFVILRTEFSQVAECYGGSDLKSLLLPWVTPIREAEIRLSPNTTMIEPKVVSPNETDIVIFLPKLSEINETLSSPKPPISADIEFKSHMKGPSSVTAYYIYSSFSIK